jgi:Glucodextranase, domain B
MRSKTERLIALLLLAASCSKPPEKPVVPETPPAPDASVAAAPVDAGPPPVAVDPTRAQAIVLSLGGAVEVRRAGSEAWVSLNVGDAVQAGDQLRTSADGRVELSLDATAIRVHEDSQVELTVLEAREVRVTVKGGGEAHAPDGKVSLLAGNAVATSNGGRLGLSWDGKTAIASAMQGTASVSLEGKVVTLREGEFTVGRDGAGLSRPQKIPRAVRLEAKWPAETLTNQAEVTVTGKVSYGARVTVAGKAVPTAADGTFSAKVPLKRGRNSVIVSAVDPFGRRASKSQLFTFDPDAPTVKGAVEYK